MALEQLASAYLKLDRAHEHYMAFNDKLNAFREASPFEIYREREPGGFSVLKLRLVARPRPDAAWGAIVGDFVSNLRAVLDHLVWAMSVNPKNPRHVEFPIEDTPDRFSSRRKTAIAAIPPEAQDIIEARQPYQIYGALTEHPLWRIKCLANADKHRTVAVVASGIYHRFGSALLGSSAVFWPFDENAQTDPVIPDESSGAKQPYMMQSSSYATARPAFAIVTQDGLHVPTDHLESLYDSVKTDILPLFHQHLFPK